MCHCRIIAGDRSRGIGRHPTTTRWFLKRNKSVSSPLPWTERLLFLPSQCRPTKAGDSTESPRVLTKCHTREHPEWIPTLLGHAQRRAVPRSPSFSPGHLWANRSWTRESPQGHVLCFVWTLPQKRSIPGSAGSLRLPGSTDSCRCWGNEWHEKNSPKCKTSVAAIAQMP